MACLQAELSLSIPVVNELTIVTPAACGPHQLEVVTAPSTAILTPIANGWQVVNAEGDYDLKC